MDVKDERTNARARTGTGPDSQTTPMVAQYLELKSQHPDDILFMRMGDFYELFFVDAVYAAPVLGIALTRRGKHAGEDIPMCGVPADRAEEYLRKLIATGRRVSVCEQTEDPAEARKRGSRSVVRREVVRVVTPGTLTEEGLLDPARENMLGAVSRTRQGGSWRYGLAAVDVSTGRFVVTGGDAVEVASELARLDPRELLVPEDVLSDETSPVQWSTTGRTVVPVARDGRDPVSSARSLARRFGVATLEGFGVVEPSELAACAMAVGYVDRTWPGGRVPVSPPWRPAAGGTMAIDPATRTNLEIVRTSSGAREGSLLGCVDATLTAGGARLLSSRLAGPSTDLREISSRHDLVERLAAATELRDGLRSILRDVPDVARALGRLATGRGGPRDILCVHGAVTAAERAFDLVERHGGPVGEHVAGTRVPGTLSDLAREIGRTLVERPPHSRKDGGFVRDGAMPDLDRTRTLASDSRKVVASLQARYCEETGIRTLRIKHTGQVGYFVEVPAAAGENLLRQEGGTFSHRQTMSDAMRFTTAELNGLQDAIDGAASRALDIEAGIFDTLCSACVLARADVLTAMDALARLDVAASAAETAVAKGWTRPTVTDGRDFSVKGGRHPVVEAATYARGEPFVANDCVLDDGRIVLVTGPNMGGKSTYLRQNAVTAVLAQAGLFVPASSVTLGIVDRLFSRVGASDDLARGRSTFMVEMVETAAILHQASGRSLVVLDEIGRGTATFDGLSIALATLEHLHDGTGCRALFATHFHELAGMASRLGRMSTATLKVTDWEGGVVFLHEVVPGVAGRSYGLQVARLAGLPATVVERARAVMAELERDTGRKQRKKDVGQGDLFTVPVPTPPRAEAVLTGMLRDIDPDALTPREALDLVYRMRGKVSARTSRDP